MEYFPLMLKQRVDYSLHKSLDDIDEIIKQICVNNKNAEICEPHLLCQGDFLDDDILYENCLNPDLRKLESWVMNRIVLQNISWRTLQVRLNIAINVLSKIELKHGSRNLRICIQDNIVKNCWSIHRAKLEKELPFYRGQMRRDPLQSTIMEHLRITQSEIETIKSAQQGNVLAFNKLFNRYKEFVDNILFSYVNDMDEAKDLTNVVFLKVHQKLSTFTDYSSFGGWLRIIANRTAIDYLRRMKEKAVELGEDTGRLPVELTNVSEEEDLVNLLEYEALLKEFEKLPEKTQRIFNLFYVEDLTTDEISKVLKIPTGTIKAILSRTRRKIKNNLNV